MTPRSTFAWSLGDNDATAAMNVSRVVPVKSRKVDGHVAVIGIEVLVGAVGETFGEAEVAA